MQEWKNKGGRNGENGESHASTSRQSHTECVQFRQALEVYDRNNYNINNTKQTKQKHPSARRPDAVKVSAPSSPVYLSAIINETTGEPKYWPL